MAYVEEQTRPASIHAEMTILGAMLVEPVAVADAMMLLCAEDFALDSHSRIYKAAVHLADAGHGVDIVTVAEELRRTKELDSIGGVPYLASLSDGLPRKLNVESYARIVRDKSLMRQLMNICESGMADASDQSHHAIDIINHVRAKIDNLDGDSSQYRPMESVADYLDDHFADDDRIFDLQEREQGVPSGFAWQDDKTGGFVAGKLYIYAARPSMGKSAKVVGDVCNLALKAKTPTALFTFEDSKHDVLQRLLCCRAHADLKDYGKGRSSDGDKRAIKKAYADYKAAPLYWDNSDNLTVSMIRAKLIVLNKSLPADKKIKVVFIDQLSFLSWADVFEKGLRTDQLIGAMTRKLKRMGKELGMAVVLVCQLGRSVTKNKDFKPTLADLKESGAIEENADVVIFFHRAEYYDRTDESVKGKGEHIIAKQRQGPVGSHVLRYIADSVEWRDEWTPKDDDSGEQIPW